VELEKCPFLPRQSWEIQRVWLNLDPSLAALAVAEVEVEVGRPTVDINIRDLWTLQLHNQKLGPDLVFDDLLFPGLDLMDH
jgi:hypothetical protein